MTTTEPPKRGRGRPPRGGVAMSRAVRVRFTDAEATHLEKLAEEHELDLAEVIRRRCFGVPLDD